MNIYQTLVDTVIINKKNHLISYGEKLAFIGKGRSAFVFKIKASNQAIKVFYPKFTALAQEEAEIYQKLQNTPYYPAIYDAGLNYIVIDYIEGLTLFECVTKGKRITPHHIQEVDDALALAVERGLNPSDVHLRNIFITSAGDIKMIDVARFRQKKDCRRWADLKKAYHQLYLKRFFPKRMGVSQLNTVAFLYKKGWLPSYRIV